MGYRFQLCQRHFCSITYSGLFPVNFAAHMTCFLNMIVDLFKLNCVCIL